MNGSKIINLLIHKATQEAYANAYDWAGSDPTISSQLQDGIRTSIGSFYEIDDTITEPAIILLLMRKKLDNVRHYYQQLPGNDGQWECSALNIISKDIDKLIKEKYIPTDDDIAEIYDRE